MTIRMDGADVFLAGDWDISGVVAHIDTLSNILQQVDEGGKTILKVDCGEIKTVDADGLQILKVWLQCARFRGIEAKLVNLSDGLQRLMLATGFTISEAGLCLDCR